MSEIRVLPVRTPAERKAFLHFPWQVYRGDPLWVPPLIPDWAERIDPQRGAFFQLGEAEFFIAWQGGRPVGTICAAENRKLNQESGTRECNFGFFNFIESYPVMECLLTRAGEWGRARGLDTLVGPFNLDYEDSYGILVEGRDRPPALLCGHTPPYYLDFVERYGFEPARGDNIAFALDLTGDNRALGELPRMAERVKARKHFTIRSARFERWDEELDRVHGLLNVALAHLPDFRGWQRELLIRELEPFRKIADPELILFAEDGDETIGWLPGIPNLNEAFIHADGLRHPWDYLKLWWHLRRRPDCLAVKSVLVPPEHWGSGVVILLFDEMARRARAKGYRWIDASLTSADNPRTPALAERFGAQLYKRYRVYRKAI